MLAGGALDPGSAEKFARLALAGLDREYPNKPGEVLRGPEDVLPPRAMHPDTAFALAQILDYARTVRDAELERLIVDSARQYYINDRAYPTQYEPSGEDFFSPGLNVADLMRRVLSGKEFSRWLDDYLPGLRRGRLGGWTTPAQVSDLSDPRIVHLVGLNLSRAWTMQGITSALPAKDRHRFPPR